MSSATEHDGRDAGGKFAKGNPGGPGNPHVKRVAELRASWFRCVKTEDLEAVYLALLSEAKSGNVAAMREYLLRCLGAPEAVDLAEDLAELQAVLERLQEAGAAA